MCASPALRNTFFLPGAFLLMIVSLRGVDGLASKTTYYYDKDCEVDSAFSTLDFGSLSVARPLSLVDFDDCNGSSGNDNRSGSRISICDTATGETGEQHFEHETCTEFDYEEVVSPSCKEVDSSSSSSREECSDNGGGCSFLDECTDDVPSTISANVVNFIANEYNDADCNEPTGNTVVISGDGLVFGSHRGECAKFIFGRYSMSECFPDGSVISQFFSPDDDTCSGEVWSQVNHAAEYSPPLCSPRTVGGMYHGYISCTTDAETVWADTPAPSFAAIGEDSGPAAGTPAPTTGLEDDADVETLAPTIHVDNGGAADTPAPASDVDDIPDTLAPAREVDDDGTTHAPAPLGDEHGDIPSPDTPAPTAQRGRSISVTVSPIADSGSIEAEEASPPFGSDAASLANGARGMGSSIAGRAAILSCAVGIFARFVM